MTKKEVQVGQRLSAARMQRSMSQEAVARRAGVAASYLSRIETGKVQPTFKTVLRITGALRVGLDEIAGPAPYTGARRGPCPVSARGNCLLDLIRVDAESERATMDEAYSPRQIRLLKRFASWLRGATSDRLRAMEILLTDLSEALASDPAESAR